MFAAYNSCSLTQRVTGKTLPVYFTEAATTLVNWTHLDMVIHVKGLVPLPDDPKYANSLLLVSGKRIVPLRASQRPYRMLICYVTD